MAMLLTANCGAAERMYAACAKYRRGTKHDLSQPGPTTSQRCSNAPRGDCTAGRHRQSQCPTRHYMAGAYFKSFRRLIAAQFTRETGYSRYYSSFTSFTPSTTKRRSARQTGSVGSPPKEASQTGTGSPRDLPKTRFARADPVFSRSIYDATAPAEAAATTTAPT